MGGGGSCYKSGTGRIRATVPAPSRGAGDGRACGVRGLEIKAGRERDGGSVEGDGEGWGWVC